MNHTDQIYLEKLYGKHAIKELIDEELAEAKEIVDSLQDKIEEFVRTSEEPEIQALEIDSESLARSIMAITLVQPSISIHEMIIKLSKFINSEEDIQLPITLMLIEYLDQEVYEIKGQGVKAIYSLDDETRNIINNKHFIPPFLIKPKPWTNNWDGGFYTKRSHVINGNKFNRHNYKQALDVVNTLQEIEWELDPTIIGYEELPNKEFKLMDSEISFNQHKETARKLYEEYRNQTFYFMWQYDKRGRIYSSGYHINLQSTGFKKALLSFKTKETITGEL